MLRTTRSDSPQIRPSCTHPAQAVRQRSPRHDAAPHSPRNRKMSAVLTAERSGSEHSSASITRPERRQLLILVAPMLVPSVLTNRSADRRIRRGPYRADNGRRAVARTKRCPGPDGRGGSKGPVPGGRLTYQRVGLPAPYSNHADQRERFEGSSICSFDKPSHLVRCRTGGVDRRQLSVPSWLPATKPVRQSGG